MHQVGCAVVGRDADAAHRGAAVVRYGFAPDQVIYALTAVELTATLPRVTPTALLRLTSALALASGWSRSS